MSQAGPIGSHGAPEPSGPVRGGPKASMQVCTIALRAGLAACLLLPAVAAPNAVWRVGAGAARAGGHSRAGAPSTHATCSSLTIPVATPVPADALFRPRDLEYRKVERELLERRYAELKHRPRYSNVRHRRHRVLDSFFQYQRWLATLSINSAADGVALSTLTPDDINGNPIEQPNGSLIGTATVPAAPDETFTSAASSLPAKDETSALELSGGSIADTGKVTVEADGGLELSFTPNWSFTAKLDGEIRPQPQLYAGWGTLNYAW
jgi:hypothetical protein